MMERLVEGARQLGLSLNERQLRQFQTYYEQLVDWNRRINLTGITDYEEVQIKHFVDSLSILLATEETTFADGNFALLDVGTGAGMPGIPLKIARPAVGLVLLESITKKTAFLQQVAGALGLDGVRVINKRAEDIGHLPDYRESFDMVVCRAVSQLATVAEITLPFCRTAGLAVIPKKNPVTAELEDAKAAIRILGGEIKGIRQVTVAGLEDRVLVILVKTSPTPSTYPRRPGIPAKRPLR
ncbi:MAG: 16S rRNA (guanine(527)-N(7))-methyltransferase RsmG [Dehalococcoidia bacterium]|nr:16S rRNA (guanine(527)-N(7))-methyltransferase RsmG [Dehalococcoidia bacterium]